MNNQLLYFLNSHGVFLLIVLVVSYLWFYKKAKEEAVHALLSCVVSGIAAIFIKELSQVPRPYVLDNSEALAGWAWFSSSLPSLHTTLAFALATTVALHQRRIGIVLLIIAGLIGFGRVAAQVHYPFDIALGALLGSIVSFLMEKSSFPGYPHRQKRHKKGSF